MKKLIIFIYFLNAILIAKAQDVIIKPNGDEINSKIIEVNIDDIKYKKTENPDGPTYSLKKSEIFMIKYANGTKDVFTKESIVKDTSTSVAIKPEVTGDMFQKGRKDSERYYTNYKGAAGGTFAATLVVGIFGLIPAIACSTTPPKDYNLGYPNAELMKNTDYYNGYVINAKRKKSNKVWTNFGIAVGINVIVYLIIVSDSGN